MNDYPISMEVEGNAAMFAEQETGSESVSYPAPPFSATKGIFESVLFLRGAVVVPTKVHICRPTRFVDVGYSSTTTPFRKANLVAGDHALRMRETGLQAPVFQLFANVETIPDDSGINHAHSYQDQFERRIRRGQSWRCPCLGRSDFLCIYVGALRPENEPCAEVNHHLPFFLHHPFDKDQDGQLAPRFVQNVLIREGVLNY